MKIRLLLKGKSKMGNTCMCVSIGFDEKRGFAIQSRDLIYLVW